MKICFCSSLYLDEEIMVNKASSQLSISSHKLIQNMIAGLEENLNEPVYLINIPEVASYPKYQQIVFKRKKWKHIIKVDREDIQIGFLNIIGIKYLIQIVELIKQLKLWIKSQKNSNLIICTYGRRFSHIIAINYIKKLYPDVITCMILGDLSGKYAGEISTLKKKNIKAYIFNRLLDYQVHKSLNFDCFVLLTKYMAQVLNLKKPYCVIEGIGHVDKYPHSNESNDLKKIVMYAGSLEIQYSILDLIEAFKMIRQDNYELWIFGAGSAEEKIKAQVNIDNRIHYYGVVSSSAIKRSYNSATVLINPRKNIGLYTKYSFPSKTMEYLASGKPVIGYKLDGMPEEYGEYMTLVMNNTNEELMKTIVKICEKSYEERARMGRRGQKFIELHKNSKAQCKKMIKLFNRI